jgi:hypothetical protein
MRTKKSIPVMEIKECNNEEERERKNAHRSKQYEQRE